MPELPEVEVLVRSLRPLLKNQIIKGVQVYRSKIIRPDSVRAFAAKLMGARFVALERRGKYLVFRLRKRRNADELLLVGHLGMTGRMYVVKKSTPMRKHTAAVLEFGREKFVFEDTRYFGRLMLKGQVISNLGPEPLQNAFTPEYLKEALRKCSQCIKVKLLDQSLVAGIGNIYASEALFRSGISPKLASRRVTPAQLQSLVCAIKDVLSEAIKFGSTVPLTFAGDGRNDALFYFATNPERKGNYVEKLHVYDREGKPCPRCGLVIQRLRQAGRSTFYCPACQK